MPIRFEERNCNFCGSSRRAFAFSYRKGKFTLVRCNDCGFYYLFPMPVLDEAAVDHTYGDQSTYSFTPVFKNDVLDPAVRRQLEMDFRHVLRFKSAGKLLEVGCCEGDALLFAGKLGFQCQGVEFTPRFAGYCRDTLKLNVAQGSLTDQHLPSDSFDVVMYRMVLEHTPWPHEELQEARRILKPDGILFLSIPNDGGLETRLQRRWNLIRERFRWTRDADESDPYWTPHHPVGFSKRSIDFICRRLGFRIEYLRTYSNPRNHSTIGLRVMDFYHAFLQGNKFRIILRKIAGPRRKRPKSNQRS